MLFWYLGVQAARRVAICRQITKFVIFPDWIIPRVHPPSHDPQARIDSNGKGKGHPRTGHEGPEEEQMYSSKLPSTSALDGLGDQRHAPAALPPEKIRYPLNRRLDGPQGRSGRMRKISFPPE